MTAREPREPEWVKPGATVVEVLDGRHGTEVRSTSVERFTNTQVVLANGSRYRRYEYDARLDRMIRFEGEGFGHRRWALCRPEDPAVATARRVLRLANAKHRAHTAYENWQRGTAPPNDVAAAFEALAKVEAES